MFNGIVTVSSRNVVFDQRNVFVAGPGSGAMENAASTDARVIDSENTIVMSWSGGAFPCRFAGIGLSRVGAVLSIPNSRTDSPHPTSASVSCPHTRMRTVSESIVGTDHRRTFGFAVPGRARSVARRVRGKPLAGPGRGRVRHDRVARFPGQRASPARCVEFDPVDDDVEPAIRGAGSAGVPEDELENVTVRTQI